MTTDQTLKQALEALRNCRCETLATEAGRRAAIAAIEQHKPVVRMLTEQELDAMYSQADSPSHQDWEQAIQRKAAEVWGLTIGEQG